MMQQEIQMTQENFQLWKSQSTKCAPQMMEGNQQYFNNSSTDCNYEEDANSTHNTMSMQYNISAKYLYECAAKILVQEAFKAAEFFFFSMMENLSSNDNSS